MSVGRVRRVLWVVLCAVAVTALSAAPASAHDDLLGTTPADGTTLATAPDQVVLTFTDPAVALGTQVVVTGPDGTDLAQGAVQLVGSTVVQPLAAARPAGVYRVDWRVTSADGHPVSNTFTFTVTSPSGPVSATPTTSPAGTAIATAAPTPASSTATVPVGTVENTAQSGRISGSGAVLGVLALVVLALVVVRIGRARSLRRIDAQRAAASGPNGTAGTAGTAETSGGA